MPGQQGAGREYAARPAPGLSSLDRLASAAQEAARVRSYRTHPDVVALRVEQVRVQVDRLCWAGIVLGLAFTMANVQRFAAGSAEPWSLPWFAAWLLDPMVSLVLLAILRAEQVTARYRVSTGRWVRRAKWFALAATYTMNTWESWVAGSVSGVVLHSVPPLVVFTAAEAVTDLRDKLTAAVEAAFVEASRKASDKTMNHTTVHGDRRTPAVLDDVHDVPQDPQMTRIRAQMTGSWPRYAARDRAGSEPMTNRPGQGKRRKLFADYLADARQAWAPDVVITPAWVREATACSRGLSSRLAAALSAEVAERRSEHDRRARGEQ
nr:hypothetical protein [Actinokineospora spheciospongiae]